MDFGIFFFNSSDEGISGNYAMHAKSAVRDRVAEQEPRVHDAGWHVLSGDLFGTRALQAILSTSAILPDGSRIDPSLRANIANAKAPDYIPYVIGMFFCPLGALRHADERLKEDGVAGYLGLATAVLPDENTLRKIADLLVLPMTPLDRLG